MQKLTRWEANLSVMLDRAAAALREARARQQERTAPDGEPTCDGCGIALVPVLVARGQRYCANCEEPRPGGH